jgi:prophage DNA circulation protein
MSWQQNLQDASWRGVRFDVIRERTTRQRALSRHEYPYQDGADLEDMGARERRFSITAVFWGDDYDTRLQAFIKVLDQAGIGELIHPVYGSIPKAQLEDYVVSHEAENVDSCEVELHFAEATPANPFFIKQTAAQQAGSVSASATSAQTSAFATFAAQISSIASTARGIIGRVQSLRNVMNYTMSTIQGDVQGVVGAALDVIEFPLTFTSNVTSFVSAIASLPSFAVGSIMTDWNSLTAQMSNIAGLPSGINGGTATVSSASGPVSIGLTTVSASTPATGDTASTSTAPVAATAITAAGANPGDVAFVTAAVQLVVTLQIASTASDILSDEASQPTLSPTDIEQIVNDTRTSINTAIAQQRNLFDLTTSRPVTEPLKDIALAIQTAAIAVIDQQPPLTTKTVNAVSNLTLLAFWWYGDYTRATELARLNPSIRNPNFVLPGTVLNAYAS